MSKRIYEFDIVKIIACIFVVGIHTIPYEGIGAYYLMIERLSVPAFFAISGYLWNGMNQSKKYNYIMKLLRILLFGTCIYLVTDFYRIINGLDTKKIFNIFFITGVRQHLWYLISLIEVLVIKLFFEKMINKKNVTIYFFFLCSAILIMYYYSLMFKNGYMPNKFYILDNCFVTGAIVEIGILCRNIKLDCKKLKYCLFGICVSLLLYFCVMIIMISRKQFIPQNASISLYISVGLIILFCSNINKVMENKIIVMLSNSTLWIYVLHPCIRDIIAVLLKIEKRSILSFMLTVIFSFMSSIMVILLSRQKSKNFIKN